MADYDDCVPSEIFQCTAKTQRRTTWTLIVIRGLTSFVEFLLVFCTDTFIKTHCASHAPGWSDTKNLVARCICGFTVIGRINRHNIKAYWWALLSGVLPCSVCHIGCIDHSTHDFYRWLSGALAHKSTSIIV